MPIRFSDSGLSFRLILFLYLCGEKSKRTIEVVCEREVFKLLEDLEKEIILSLLENYEPSNVLE